jgi:glycosyltransferase EpsE
MNAESPPSPRVSIAMGVYNCTSTLAEAINSISDQTFQNWELIICDDGSTDTTLNLAESFAVNDSRIRIIKNESNLGLNHSLNKCLHLAAGEYYARMDGDDISLPQRLQRLVVEMDADPSVAVISSDMILFDENGEWSIVRQKQHPVPIDLVNGPTFCHAPCMMRTKVLKSLGGYGTDKWLKRSQDYHLWFRLFAAGYTGKNIPEALYKARDNRGASLRRSFASRLIEARIMFGGFRLLKFPLWTYLKVLRPLILGIMPAWLYESLRKLKRRSSPSLLA